MTQTQGRYAVVDTTLTKTDSTLLDSLSGRQGDNGRVVYFAIKDGNLPHNLDGQDVQLSVKDAAGKIKVLTGIYDMVSATAGLFSMLIPAEFYQAAGDIEEAYLSVKDENNTTVSSIPITFSVFPNGVIVSANASRDFISSIDDLIKESQKEVSKISDNIEAQEIAYNTLNTALKTMTSLIEEKQVPTLNSNNEFSRGNTFNQNVRIRGTLYADEVMEGTTAKTNAINIPFEYQIPVDLNELPENKDLYSYKAFYFNSDDIKNTPNNLTLGLVENFVVSPSSIFQRVTELTSPEIKVWNRLIHDWMDSNKVTYDGWVSN
ncbi:BppU family phage baseplate upper protein [Leuconostoc falkenbergense]|uniref:BppU family phage baseplate upper protein n=1 Tax=Leuconostoc falkenbergense TaxID=2766470 RepID=UPI0028B23F00|nr:BppU family phage baseplate upper protein [Leuconostoc falkenbergense]